jgi:hypothetical protein
MDRLLWPPASTSHYTAAAVQDLLSAKRSNHAELAVTDPTDFIPVS